MWEIICREYYKVHTRPKLDFSWTGFKVELRKDGTIIDEHYTCLSMRTLRPHIDRYKRIIKAAGQDAPIIIQHFKEPATNRRLLYVVKHKTMEGS